MPYRRSTTENPFVAGSNAHADEADTDTLREPTIITDHYRIETRRLPQESNGEAAAPQ
jgi:hypothetical protein